MVVNTQDSCPVCEFEKGNKGKPVKEASGMVCLSCGASWKNIASDRINTNTTKTKYERASTALVDNRIFNKRHFENSKNHSGASSVKEKTSFYGSVILGFLLLISAGIFLQTWIWLNPEIDALRLADVKLEEKAPRGGSNVYTVRGVLLNETSSHKPVPRISIVLRSAEGKALVRWYHNSPVVSMRSNSQKYFASSVMHYGDEVAYAEASFGE